MVKYKLYIIGSALYVINQDTNESVFETDSLQVSNSWINLDKDNNEITIKSNVQDDVKLSIDDLIDEFDIPFTYEKIEITRNSNFKTASGGSGAKNETYTTNDIDDKLSSKVDKDGTKVLSDNNFTSTQKTKLDELDTKSESDALLNLKVDKDGTKALSDNNFDDYYRWKLENLPTHEEYSLDLDSKVNKWDAKLKGYYDSSKNYAINDIVVNENKFYRAVNDIPPNSEFLIIGEGGSYSTPSWEEVSPANDIETPLPTSGSNNPLLPNTFYVLTQDIDATIQYDFIQDGVYYINLNGHTITGNGGTSVFFGANYSNLSNITLNISNGSINHTGNAQPIYITSSAGVVSLDNVNITTIERCVRLRGRTSFVAKSCKMINTGTSRSIVDYDEVSTGINPITIKMLDCYIQSAGQRALRFNSILNISLLDIRSNVIKSGNGATPFSKSGVPSTYETIIFKDNLITFNGGVRAGSTGSWTGDIFASGNKLIVEDKNPVSLKLKDNYATDNWTLLFDEGGTGVEYVTYTEQFPSQVNSNTIIPHGQDITKILGFMVMGNDGGGNYYPPSFTGSSNRYYSVYLTTSSIIVRLGSDGSSLVNDGFKITLIVNN